MTFENRKGPDESQFCRQTVPGLRTGDSVLMVARRLAGTRTSAVDAERSRRRETTSDSG